MQNWGFFFFFAFLGSWNKHAMKNLNDFQCTSLKRVITKWPPSPCVPTDTAMKYQGGGALFLMILHNWTTDSQLHVLYIPPYFLHSFLLSKFLSLSLSICTTVLPIFQVLKLSHFLSLWSSPLTQTLSLSTIYTSLWFLSTTIFWALTLSFSFSANNITFLKSLL